MIRPATTADAPSLAALCGQLGYPTTVGDTNARMDALTQESGHTTQPVFVYELAGRVVAWMQLREAATLESGLCVEIIGLVVDESARSGGIGSTMVDFAKTWARERGHARLRVRTNQTRTRTHEFYERKGFTLTKVQRVYDLSLAP